jgi:curved DNA-binding protein CbpA
MGLKEQDYYERLELKRNASDDEIRRAYQERAKVCHPDARFISNVEDQDKNEIIAFYQEMFELVTEAYQTLIDERKRRIYDQRYSWGDEAAETKEQILDKPIPVKVRVLGKS